MTDAGVMSSDMRAELDRFDSEAEAIIVAFVGPMDSLAPPPVICHYTNDAGLKGILESGTTWLTDMFDLNDPSEVKHGFSRAVNILYERSARYSPGSSRHLIRKVAEDSIFDDAEKTYSKLSKGVASCRRESVVVLILALH